VGGNVRQAGADGILERGTGRSGAHRARGIVSDYAEKFSVNIGLFMHAPVLVPSSDGGDFVLAPLRPLPGGGDPQVQPTEAVGCRNRSTLLSTSAYSLDVWPRTGRPLAVIPPLEEGSTGRRIPHGSVIDFDACGGVDLVGKNALPPPTTVLPIPTKG
jgi:hypothetical protein